MRTGWLKDIMVLTTLAVSLVSQADISDMNNVLAVYESNSEAHVVLTSRENPKQVIASGIASPVHVSHTCKNIQDVVEVSMEGMGHPGTIRNTDSEGVLFAAALDQLKASILCSLEEMAPDEIKLAGFYIGIAGYEAFHDARRVYPLSDQEVTKEAFLWHDYTNILSQRGFYLKGNAARKMEGEHHTLSDAVRFASLPDKELESADFIQLTTYSIGYLLWESQMASGSNTELHDSDVPQGGYFALGKRLQKQYLQDLAFNTTAAALEKPALQVLNLAPIVQHYEQVKMGARLNSPKVGYKVEGLPDKRFNHYFSRLYTSPEMIRKEGLDPKVVRSSIMVNEGGYTVAQVLDPRMVVKHEGIKEDVWQTGIRELSGMVKTTIEQPVVKLATQLAEKRKQNGWNKAPLVLTGELNLEALGIRHSLEKLLSERRDQVIFMSPEEFRAGLAAAGVARLPFPKDEL